MLDDECGQKPVSPVRGLRTKCRTFRGKILCWALSNGNSAFRATAIVAAGCLWFASTALTQTMADTTPTNSSQKAITLYSHNLSLVLDDKANLGVFADAVNDKARIKGLADTLNPGILDVEKLRALVAALAGQPES